MSRRLELCYPLLSNSLRSLVKSQSVRYISKKTYKWPEVLETDLEEVFIRGSGPGGQAVAKTNNCVQIKHMPTGIVVRSHETRSQSENRQKAREKLVYQLDILYNKDNSFDAISKREKAEKIKKNESRAKKTQDLKKEFKLREGLTNKGKAMGTQTEHFIVNKDLFSGYTIDTKKQSFTSAEEYDSHLEKALPRWQADGVRGLWAKISLEHSHLTPVFAKHGLDFHHAQPGYVMMTKWLPTDEPNSIPEYANQYLGCAGFTVNDKNQLLVIQEKRGPAAFGQHWKLPGGHADKNEMLGEAARREVLEETGIDTEFLGIICFRHMLNYRYGCSDFYYICLMRPVNAEQPIKKCEQEIAACKWMDVDEFIRDPNTTSANNFFAECYKRAFKDGILITPSDVASHDKKTNHSVYSVSSIEQLNKSM